ncbi:MAG: addiction module protein [Deltaproteobacteria bacterium]|nr:addiction module protein [Deltaproteobacteria bacterium]
MISTLQISQMSREEKLRALEALWADLSKDDNQIESPARHEDILQETEARVATGQERIEDWQTAKRELRKRFE